MTKRTPRLFWAPKRKRPRIIIESLLGSLALSVLDNVRLGHVSFSLKPGPVFFKFFTEKQREHALSGVSRTVARSTEVGIHGHSLFIHLT